MKTEFFKHPWSVVARQRRSGGLCATVMMALLLAAANLTAMPVVTTLTGGPSQFYPQTSYGFVDGDTASSAKFHTPYGIALDAAAGYLFVADRDNNAVRQLDLAGNWTYTFVPNAFVPASLIAQPVGVALDSSGNVYVLNRGNGNNGTVLQFDTFGDLVKTNASGLTNAAGIALDGIGNLYLTVQGNTLIRIAPSGTQTTVATIAEAGAALQGIVFKHNGSIAACDSGRHGIYLIDPISGVVTTNAGFHGAGDFTSANNVASSSTARFNQPYGVTEAGDGTLVVADYGNHRVKVVLTSGVVSNLYGVSSSYWYGPANPSQGIFPGWWDGTVTVPDLVGGVEARQPVGVVFAPDSTVYTTETYYHVIRKVSTVLPQPPPPPPPVPAPQIGWVSFPPPDLLSAFNAGSSFVFNNDVILAIRPGTNGSQVFFTSGATPATGSIPDPAPGVGNTPPIYPGDGSLSSAVTDLPGTRYPDMTIKAIGTKNDGSPNSLVVQARIQFITANPVISGNNAAQFTITNQTVGAQMWYTIDGTDPTNAAPSLGPISSGTTLSINIITNTTFKIRAFRTGYQPSGVVSSLFSATNFVANSISFGFASGEASSDFVASPGQFFYAPVTLSTLSGTKMYSLQFNLTVTNAGPNPGPVVTPGATGFESFLEKPIPDTTPVLYERIPPLSFSGYQADPPPASAIVYYDGLPFVSMMFTNLSENLLGVGWLERYSKTNLYDTTKQDLIKYSQPHDTLFDEIDGRIVAGGYAFQVPTNASPLQTYQIQIGRPSATSDGVGGPGADVYIATPTNGSLNSIKIVTVGQRKYVVGDVAPFRWFNAGDFGKGYLANADVMQVFQSAIYRLNYPPAGSDFFDAMDSCCGTYVTNINGYLEASVSIADTNALFFGNDSSINSIAFGDGKLDVTDVYVTFRRSLDPSLVWFQRFWTNGVRGAEFATNTFRGGGGSPDSQGTIYTASPNLPEVAFACTDLVATAGQILQIPVTANVLGSFPLRVLMLNLTVQPLDGSPALTDAIQFAPAPGLGQPTLSGSRGNGNYSGAWLNSQIAGFTGDSVLGILTVRIPSGCPASAAYALHFDHVSGSPNGIIPFPNKPRTGLITLSDRSASSWGDGIPDSWRLRYFGSINNLLSAASADADGDGATNLEESKADTDPLDANSNLRLHSGRQSQDFVIHWPTIANKRYVVERAPTLYGPTWTPVLTNTGTGFDIECHDPNPGAASGFYRVRLQE